MAEPVILELQGNACADLAGCLLIFENPLEPIPLRPDGDFNPLQRGTIGDLTASRKVRVMELPTAEAYLRKKEGLPVPEHMANSLYLEWFSQANGRVVIESADYKLKISAPRWRLTADQEDQHAAHLEGRQPAQGLAGGGHRPHAIGIEPQLPLADGGAHFAHHSHFLIQRNGSDLSLEDE